MPKRISILTAVCATMLTLPATAQTVDPVQQCVWQCLSNSPGAESAEYAQCVVDRCSDIQPFTRAGSDRWVSNPLFPQEPPYVDGGSAAIVSFDGMLQLTYVCGRNGDSYFFLEGAPLQRLGLISGGASNVGLTVDRRPTRTFSAEGFEGTLTWSANAQNAIFADLRAGSGLFIDLPGWSTDFSLRGSSAALNAAVSLCQPVPVAEAQDTGVDVLPPAEEPEPLDTSAAEPPASTPFILSAARQAELRAAAETQDPAAMNQLGVALVSGRFGVFDPSGYDLIIAAAEAGYPPALVNRAYFSGSHEQSYTDGFQDLMRAVDAGDPVALLHIAFAYDIGNGTPMDGEKARDYFERALDAGDWDAALNLNGLPHPSGKFDTLNDRAIAAGHRISIFNTFLWGPVENRKEALRLMVEAANGVPAYHTYDDGLRYLPNMAMDSDSDLLLVLQYARRYGSQNWNEAELNQILRPFQLRYDCLDGELYFETTEIISCWQG